MKKYISILAGAGILAFGIYNVHARCDISEGGVLGLSLLLYRWLHISPGIGNLIMDAAAMVAGAWILKQNFLLDSVIASVAYSLWYALLECFDPLLPDLSSLPPIAAVAGGLFVGIGTALIVRHGCAAGADDSLALIAQATLHIPPAVFYIVSDFVVLLLSLSYIPFQRIIWSLVSVSVSSGLIALLCPQSPNTAAEN